MNKKTNSPLKEIDLAKPAPLTKEVREYYSSIGKIGGMKNKLKGPEYFSRISKMKTGMKYKKNKKGKNA